VGALYKSNPVVTHSLKPPGFNPCAYEVRKTGFKVCSFKCNLCTAKVRSQRSAAAARDGMTGWDRTGGGGGGHIPSRVEGDSSTLARRGAAEDEFVAGSGAMAASAVGGAGDEPLRLPTAPPANHPRQQQQQQQQQRQQQQQQRQRQVAGADDDFFFGGDGGADELFALAGLSTGTRGGDGGGGGGGGGAGAAGGHRNVEDIGKTPGWKNKLERREHWARKAEELRGRREARAAAAAGAGGGGWGGPGRVAHRRRFARMVAATTCGTERRTSTRRTKPRTSLGCGGRLEAARAFGGRCTGTCWIDE
jgi:hypothetical protein